MPVLALSLCCNEQILEIPWFSKRIGGYQMQFNELSSSSGS
jgi:hypothetical protein